MIWIIDLTDETHAAAGRKTGGCLCRRRTASEVGATVMKRLILFGAGASFGSPSVLPTAPPLGIGLFDVLQKSFPDSWGSISGAFRARFEDNFEAGMEDIWNTYPAALSSLVDGVPSPNVLMQDMARFFLCFTLGPRQRDCYSRFLLSLDGADKLRETRFATLNYEHLLEQAMVQCGMRPAVIRPHGSCQFWPKRGGRLRGDGTRAIGQGFHQVSTRVRQLTRQQTADRLNEVGQAGYPCMAIYIRSKVTQAAQQYLRRIQLRFRDAVLSSERIALVGVRPWRTDTHIWDSIARTCATVLYVGGSSGFDDLRSIRDNQGTEFVGERFDQAIDTLVVKL
jgi:hypothetical protein